MSWWQDDKKGYEKFLRSKVQLTNQKRYSLGEKQPTQSRIKPKYAMGEFPPTPNRIIPQNYSKYPVNQNKPTSFVNIDPNDPSRGWRKSREINPPQYAMGERAPTVNRLNPVFGQTWVKGDAAYRAKYEQYANTVKMQPAPAPSRIIPYAMGEKQPDASRIKPK